MVVIVFIIILALLVLVHEFGHFYAAKKQGVLVEEFGFGFPPRIFGIKRGETLYSINLIPLGGFVKVYGEEYHEDKKLNLALKNRAFVYKKPWQKALIIVSGIIGNFLLGWVLISFLFTQGVPVPIDRAVVEKVQPSSPAQKAGVKEKDVVTKILKNGEKYEIVKSSDLIDYSKRFAGQTITFEILRNDKTIRVSIEPRKNPPQGQGPLGILISSYEEKKYPWYQAPFFGLIEATSITKRVIVELLTTLGEIITFQKPSLDVAGPIGIARFTGQAIKVGNKAVLELAALLSLNLAVINIFPFPALDGGRLSFVLYEWITKRRINKVVEKYTNIIGIIMLLSLAVLITISDIVKIYK